VTEFIGISLALQYLGLSKELGVIAAAGLVIGAAGTGDFRRFERFALTLVFGSFLLVPVFLAVHPPTLQIARDFVTPQFPLGSKLSDLMLLVIAIVGTTVAPWQLFFQQSYVIDKRITPRFMRYARIDLWLGIAIVLVGAVAMICFTAAAFEGRPEFGNFQDAGAVAAGLEAHSGRIIGVLFAVALLDACVIGACAVSLATAYAIGDVLSVNHSLHRRPKEAKAFYIVYGSLVVAAAALVLTPGTPLGLLTSAVQTLAGVLLPSATVFLLLLCNDKTVLGPWINGRWVNLFTGAVVAALVLLSIILTASALFPDIDDRTILAILVSGVAAALLVTVAFLVWRRGRPVEAIDRSGRALWRMPPLEALDRPRMTTATRLWMAVLRGYLVVAAGLVLVRIVHLAMTAAGG
jgi:Mn2+/Fe2+ NRAMP family transporter